MSQYNISVAETEDDESGAYELFYRSFGPTYYESREKFDISRRYDRTLKPQNLYIARNADNKVIAALRSVERELNIFNRKFTIGGIATTAVHPDYRGLGLFDDLTTFALNDMMGKRLAMCLVFARRAIDNIYIKHGFWGTPVEKKFTLISPPWLKNEKYDYIPIDEENMGIPAKLYREVYSDVPVFLSRSDDLWLSKVFNPSFGQNIRGYLCYDRAEGDYGGYVIAESGTGIIEVCASKESEGIYNELLFSGNSPFYNEVARGLCLPDNHPAMIEFAGEAHSVYRRHPHNGGNVMRILNHSEEDSEIMSLLAGELSRRGVEMPELTDKCPDNIYLRIITAALFGYEVPETRDVLNIEKQSEWNLVKPLDFIFTPMDDF